MNLPGQATGRPATDRILLVDDDARVLSGLVRNLGGRFRLDTAPGGAEALEAVAARGPYAVVVADMRMPGMDGVELLGRVRELAPETVRVMLTGQADLGTAQAAVNQGNVFLFLTKPCPVEDLAEALAAALRQHRLVTAERELLEQTLAGCVQLLSDVLGAIEGPWLARTGPAAELALRLAVEQGIPDPWQVRVAALLAPLGLLTVPRDLLARFEAGGELSGDERALLTYFPETSAGILGHLPRLEGVGEMVLYQGRNFDGTGFPDDGAAGTAIPVGARILRVSADFVALEAAWGHGEAALAELRQREGCYDPQVLDALARILEAEEPGREPAARTVEELAPMDLLAAPVLTLSGEPVAPGGIRLTPALLAKLRNHHLLEGLREPVLVHPG
jgi:response regulator RpfG family c-di-GMP phosphodiesterase